MVYRALADAVVLTHFAFVVFVVVGSLPARRRPALIWLHLPALAWAVGIITVGYECPLTALENHLRRLGGERVYPGGFIDHYIENVLYPQRLTPLLLTLAGGTVILGYAALLTDRLADRRRRSRRGSGWPDGPGSMAWQKTSMEPGPSRRASQRRLVANVLETRRPAARRDPRAP